MAYSPQKGDVQVSAAVFGGKVSVMSAASLPEGVSPDCQDVGFLPGSVFSRPAFQKAITALGPGLNGLVPTFTYAKSFVTPTGQIENLYLDSNGVIYWEDVVNAPGVLTQIGTTGVGLWAKSITANGKEYIAISDGLHGQDAPLQWDGTNLDRVTQEGPGAAPAVASISLPSVVLAGNGSPAAINVVSCTPSGQVGGIYTSFIVVCSASVATISTNDLVTIAGSSQAFFNTGWTVNQVAADTNTLIINIAFPTTQMAGAGGTVTPQGGSTMIRGGNTVTAFCAGAHNLQVGYQAQITGITAAAVGTISSIVINNEDNPGIATVTTTAAHGLRPGLYVSIEGVVGVALGGGIASISRSGGITTVTMTTAHGLVPGAVVTIASTTLASGTGGFNGVAVVANVTSATVFTFGQSTQTDAVGNNATGTASINWPIPATATPTYFEVLAAPTATTFQVAINYTDATWTTGTVTFAWDGTFYVSAVLSPTSFQYQQYGPDAHTNVVGTVTPWGQIAPGIRQCQLHFLTRQGYITKPGPPVQFTSNGGQYVSVSNIPIGPPNVVARILSFTSAEGAYFFYIPTPAQINGQQISTATQINDNTTTGLLLDFSDPTLLNSTGVSIPGNNLAAQIVLDSALGFGIYGSRLMAWGMRNRIQNLLGMDFDSGYIAAGLTTVPLGWTVGSADDGVFGGSRLTTGHYGQGWSIRMIAPNVQRGVLSQTMYQDAYGAPIATPSVTYKLRAWFKISSITGDVTFTAQISSASTGFSTNASINSLNMNMVGNFQEATFGLAMPANIPADLTLTIWAQSTAPGVYTLLVDELSIIYAQTPYLDTVFYVSYADNPEAIDGVTGKMGSTQDDHKIMEMADIRKTGYFLTQDPGGRLHQFTDNGVTEPAGWAVSQVAANCGLISAFGLTKSQADDSSAAGGEEWFAWISSTAARIFGGDQPWEMSREIRPDWDLINPAFQQFCWALNDPAERIIYFGLTLGGAIQGTANKIYTLNYVGLDSAYALGTTGPVKIALSGKLIATDHARKWAPWNATMNGAALMFREAGRTQPVFWCGNGLPPGETDSFGNVYTLNPAKYTDDDYGLIVPYWVSYFMPDHQQEEGFQLGGWRKLLVYVAAFVSSPVACNLVITPYVDNVINAWAITAKRPLVSSPAYDIEFAGCSAQGNRIALKFASVPNAKQTDNAFNLQRMTAFLRKVARLPVRGAA